MGVMGAVSMAKGVGSVRAELFDGSFGELGGFFRSTEVLRDETKEPVGTKEGMNGGWGSEENVTSSDVEVGGISRRRYQKYGVRGRRGWAV